VDKFDDLFDSKHREAALNCSSEMVLNSLRHAEECLVYMAGIKEQGVFTSLQFPDDGHCHTGARVSEPRIFETNVKIKKGETAQLFMESSQNLRTVCAVFKKYVRRIHRKNTPKDPNFLNINIACGKVEQFIESIYPSQDPNVLAQLAKDGGSAVVVTKRPKLPTIK